MLTRLAILDAGYALSAGPSLTMLAGGWARGAGMSVDCSALCWVKMPAGVGPPLRSQALQVFPNVKAPPEQTADRYSPCAMKVPFAPLTHGTASSAVCCRRVRAVMSMKHCPHGHRRGISSHTHWCPCALAAKPVHLTGRYVAQVPASHHQQSLVVVRLSSLLRHLMITLRDEGPCGEAAPRGRGRFLEPQAGRAPGAGGAARRLPRHQGREVVSVLNAVLRLGNMLGWPALEFT